MGGYQVVYTGRIGTIGGTSASTPAFAGMVSLLNEERLKNGKPPMGYLNKFIYQNADAFRDVVTGDDLVGRQHNHLQYGFTCAKGWDPVTGLGTPNFPKLLEAAMKVSTAEIVV